MGHNLMQLRRGVLLNTPHLETASGEVVSFSTDMASKLKEFITRIEPLQDLHGYSNPWPAGGGKNKCSPMEQGTVSENFPVGTAYSEMALDSTTRIRSIDLIYVGANPFCISFDDSLYDVGVAGFDENKLYLGRKNAWRGFIAESPQVYDWADTRYISVILRKKDNSTITDADRLTSHIQVELNTQTPSAYSPYSNICPISGYSEAKVYVSPTQDAQDATVYTIDLDGTRYGGTLDLATGVLTVTKRYFVADGVNIKTTGGYGAGGPKWLPCIVLGAANKAVSSTSNATIISSYLKTTGSIQATENCLGIGNKGDVIPLHIGTMQGTDGTHGYNSANEVHAAVNAYLQSNPLEVCYTLLTPFTVQLTAQQIRALKGANNIWARVRSLAPGYTQVEYLQSTTARTQYINSGVDADSYEVDYQYMQQYSGNTVYSILGSRNSNSTIILSIAHWGGNILPAPPDSSVGAIDTDRHTMKNGAYFGNKTIYDGVEVFSYSSYSIVDGQSVYLFGENRANVHYGASYCRIYSAKLYKNGNLVRDFVPCVRLSDSAAGMYDRVSYSFFPNAGSGAFDTGPAVVEDSLQSNVKYWTHN